MGKAMTVTIQIGNSDDKLTQIEWAKFIYKVNNAIRLVASSIHFFGTSANTEEWQNAAWVIEIEKDQESLTIELERLCHLFKQDSIAWTEGTTYFIR